jgi:Uma2 family endonuclease
MGERIMAATVTGSRRLLQSQPYRWTRQEFEKMTEIGLFSPDVRLELIEGEILEMAAHTSHHATAITIAQQQLIQLCGPDYHLRVQLPLALTDDSEPEPDLAIVAGGPEAYWHEHPRKAVLVVEVAYSSVKEDQDRKRRLYAHCQIPAYSILNLNERCFEVYRDPHSLDYQTKLIFTTGAVVSPLAFADKSVDVAGLLPRA